MNMVKVLVVDDSSTMRMLITAALQACPEIEVIGHAAGAHEAREKIKTLNPDVITLDIDMPNMNGIEFLEKIMRLRPMPVVMISSMSEQRPDFIIRAMELGAFDYLCKAELNLPLISNKLINTVLNAAASRHKTTFYDHKTNPGARTNYRWNGKIVAIGSSTGGVDALITVLSEYPENCPPTLITQHMPEAFTKSFANRLNNICAANVCEAFNGAPVKQGQVYLAPGGLAHLEIGGTVEPKCKLVAGETINGHRPSVDALFHSVARYAHKQSIGVILTGMGKDGAEGLLEMRQAGSHTIGQDEASSLVYGMPRVAEEIGAVQTQLSIDKIGQKIISLTSF